MEGTRLHKRGFGSAEDGEGPSERRRESLTPQGDSPPVFAFAEGRVREPIGSRRTKDLLNSDLLRSTESKM